MTLKVTIMSDELGVEADPGEGQALQAQVEMTARRSLSGDILVQDHTDIDIVVYPDEMTVVTFPKKTLNDRVYAIQDHFFKYLAKKGVIKRETVQSGNLFSSLQADINPAYSENVDPVQTAVFIIGKYLHQEAPSLLRTKRYRDEEVDKMTDPDDKNSTRLGEVPQGEEKGTMNTRMSPFNWEYSYSPLRESSHEEK